MTARKSEYAIYLIDRKHWEGKNKREIVSHWLDDTIAGRNLKYLRAKIWFSVITSKDQWGNALLTFLLWRVLGSNFIHFQGLHYGL